MSLDATPLPRLPIATFNCESQNAIRTQQTVVDGCPVLPKLQCHEVHMGQNANLLWNFKSPQGSLIDLSECLQNCNVGSQVDGDFDVVDTPTVGPTLRMREISGFDPTKDRVVPISVAIVDAAQGLVRSDQLPNEIVRFPGVYLEEWAVFDTNGNMLFSNHCCTFVRPGLFGISSDLSQRNLGPPTLEEIRLSMRDNAPADNMLLDDVEFDAAEISQAVLRPVRRWNEIPPPIQPLMTTKTFPFREMWLLGIQAYLFEMVSHHYRRNQLAYNAGGVSLDDKNKEKQYREASMQLMQQFNEMLRAKKMEINIALFSGSLGSPYSGMFYP